MRFQVVQVVGGTPTLRAPFVASASRRRLALLELSIDMIPKLGLKSLPLAG